MATVEFFQVATRCLAIEPEPGQDPGECHEDDKSGSCCFDAAVKALQKKAEKRERQKERKRLQRLTSGAGDFADSP
jgi:hypothetical protein